MLLQQYCKSCRLGRAVIRSGDVSGSRHENYRCVHPEGRASGSSLNRHAGRHAGRPVAAGKQDLRAACRSWTAQRHRGGGRLCAANHASGVQRQRRHGWKGWGRHGEGNRGRIRQAARRTRDCHIDGIRRRRVGGRERQRARHGGGVRAERRAHAARQTRGRQVDAAAEAVLRSDRDRARPGASLYDAQAAWRCGKGVVRLGSHGQRG